MGGQIICCSLGNTSRPPWTATGRARNAPQSSSRRAHEQIHILPAKRFLFCICSELRTGLTILSLYTQLYPGLKIFSKRTANPLRAKRSGAQQWHVGAVLTVAGDTAVSG